jgi:glycosyltransferase involved in cell wall biosynthesis
VRLLVLSQYFWPESFRVNELVSALTERGHEVTVLTGIPNYPDGRVFPEYRADKSRYSVYGSVPVVRVPLAPRGVGGPLRLALNYLSFVLSGATVGVWRLRGRPFDAVLVHQPSPITACLPALVIGRVKGAPVLLWTLDLWPETLEALGAVRSRAGLAAMGLLVSFIYRRCALVLGQSRAFRESVARHAGSEEKFRYFPQWTERIFDGNGQYVEAAPEVRAFPDTFNVLFAGNIGEAQDFPAILEAAERLKERTDIRWLIVGDGRAAPWLKDEIGRRYLSHCVHLLGRHPVERMPSFFCGADALLVSLKSEPVFALTIPGKVQSYLASGVPLLGMLDGEGARVIEEAGAGLTCPAGDGAALAANVERLAATSVAEREAMGRRAVAYAEAEFDRDRLLNQLEEWLREVRTPGS